MLIYWALFGFFAAGALATRPMRPGVPVRQPFLIVGAILTAVLIGIRYKVGADWPTYDFMFDYAARASLGRVLQLGDPAYEVLNWTVQQFGGAIWMVNLVCGAIFTWGLLRFCRAQPDPWLAVAIAIPYLVIVVAMGYTRQAVALGILMAGLAAFQRGGVDRSLCRLRCGRGVVSQNRGGRFSAGRPGEPAQPVPQPAHRDRRQHRPL